MRISWKFVKIFEICYIFVKFLGNLSHLRFPGFPTILLDFRPIFPVLRAILSISKPFNEFAGNFWKFVQFRRNLLHFYYISRKFVKSLRNFSNFRKIRCIFVKFPRNLSNLQEIRQNSKKCRVFLLNFGKLCQKSVYRFGTRKTGGVLGESWGVLGASRGGLAEDFY